MLVTLDHMFIWTSLGAPEAERLELGLAEDALFMLELAGPARRLVNAFWPLATVTAGYSNAIWRSLSWR